jgi:hypothetical protein
MQAVSQELTWWLGERFLIGTGPGSRKRGEEVCGGEAGAEQPSVVQQLSPADGSILHIWRRSLLIDARRE